jgi:hypothetical protein
MTRFDPLLSAETFGNMNSFSLSVAARRLLFFDVQGVIMDRRSAIAERILTGEDPLRRMDIFLTRNRSHFVSRMISVSTRCFWSHAAVVFVIPDESSGFHKAFIMESTGAGVDIHNATKYFDQPDLYDFAILRLKADWFSGEEKTGIRKHARGRMLDSIDAQYDRKRILHILYEILFRKPLHFLSLARDRYRGRHRPPPRRLMQAPLEYICSGFVSWAYFETARREGQEVRDAVFHPAYDRIDPTDEAALHQLILSTKPVDIFTSDRVEWKWVCLDGELRRVATREDAEAFRTEVYGDAVMYPRPKRGHRKARTVAC